MASDLFLMDFESVTVLHFELQTDCHVSIREHYIGHCVEMIRVGVIVQNARAPVR